jgi:hypothetical protein
VIKDSALPYIFQNMGFEVMRGDPRLEAMLRSAGIEP